LRLGLLFALTYAEVGSSPPRLLARLHEVRVLIERAPARKTLRQLQGSHSGPYDWEGLVG